MYCLLNETKLLHYTGEIMFLVSRRVLRHPAQIQSGILQGTVPPGND